MARKYERICKNCAWFIKRIPKSVCDKKINEKGKYVDENDKACDKFEK